MSDWCCRKHSNIFGPPYFVRFHPDACPYCRIDELEQQLADEQKAAGYWMEQSCKDHNRAEKAEEELQRYQGAVEVEGIIGEDIMTTGRFVQADVPLSFKNRQRVRVLMYPQTDKGAVALKEVE